MSLPSKTIEPKHGGDLHSFSELFQVKEAGVLDFSSNINPLGISESARRVYLESADELKRYPDPHAREFCRELTRHFPVRYENLLAGNGSIALLNLAIEALAPKRALLVEPCFVEYRRLLELEGVKVRSLKLKASESFRFNLSRIYGALEGMDLLILGQPNNPTGTGLARHELLDLLESARRAGVFVIVDEAFVDWHPELSVSDEVKEDGVFLVLRSLTKFFGLAGIRAGFAIGPSPWIAAMKARQETWSFNRIAQKISVAVLQDRAFQEKSRQWFSQETVWFYHQLKSFQFLNVYPSLANFFLIQFKQSNAPFWVRFLAREGICVRGAEDFPGLDHSFFRIAVRWRHENERLIRTFEQWKQKIGIPADLPAVP